MKRILIILLILSTLILTSCTFNSNTNTTDDEHKISSEDLLKMKEQAKLEIDQTFNAEYNFCDKDLEIINARIETGKNAIDKATTPNEVNSHKETFIKSINDFQRSVINLYVPCGIPITCGDGTKDNPFIIANPGNLICFINWINSGINNDSYFELANDIDCKEFIVSPIGIMQDREFCGYFNGNGHEIKNFILQETYMEGLMKYFGLFGNNKGIIENLGMVNFAYFLTWSSSRDNIREVYIGGISGWNEGVIRNCYSIGRADLVYWDNTIYALHPTYFGGISGVNEGKIENSYVDIKAEFEIKKNREPGSGSIHGIAHLGRKGIITNCLAVFTGKVVCERTEIALYDDEYFYGIGDRTSNIENSYFYNLDYFKEYPHRPNKFKQEDLNDSNFYIEILKWDPSIWDLTNIYIEKESNHFTFYPKIYSKE